MGTSTSQSSPKTLNWKAVGAVYKDPKVPVRRVVNEIWRAAQSTPDTNMGTLLTSKDIYSIYNILDRVNNPNQAYKEVNASITTEKKASLITEIGKRALVQATLGKNKKEDFIRNLVVETTNYLISRDLSSHLGSERLKDVNQLSLFKSNVLNEVAEKISGSYSIPQTKNQWNRSIKIILNKLSREK